MVLSRAKHLRMHLHWVRAAVEDKELSIEYVPTEDNLADLFTKVLPKTVTEKLSSSMGLRLISVFENSVSDFSSP